MKNLMIAAFAFLLFSCGSITENPCWYNNECNSGCIEKVDDKYYCSHCCLAESQKPEGYKELDKASLNTPVEISEEELKGLHSAN